MAEVVNVSTETSEPVLEAENGNGNVTPVEATEPAATESDCNKDTCQENSESNQPSEVVGTEAVLIKSVTDETDLTNLEKKIINQVEFYFGNYNLHRDKFMREHSEQNDGWFSTDVMLKFQKLSSLCSEPGTILAALKKSKNGLMDVDIEGMRMRRSLKRPLPPNDVQYRRGVTQRTVYVKGFPQTETIEDIGEFLRDFGLVEGIQLRRHKNKEFTGATFKGSLLATFSKLEEAQRFLQAPMVYYKDQALEKKTKDEWMKEQNEQSKLLAKKPKNTGKKETKETETLADDASTEPATKEDDAMHFLLVTNLDDDTITHMDMKNLFDEIEAPNHKFFGRFEKGGLEGYILFGEAGQAEDALGLLKEKKNDGVVSMKNAGKVTFELLPEDRQMEAEERYKEFRLAMSRNKNRGPRKFDNNRQKFGNRKNKSWGNKGGPAAKKQRV